MSKLIEHNKLTEQKGLHKSTEHSEVFKITAWAKEDVDKKEQLMF